MNTKRLEQALEQGAYKVAVEWWKAPGVSVNTELTLTRNLDNENLFTLEVFRADEDYHEVALKNVELTVVLELLQTVFPDSEYFTSIG